MAGGDEWRDVTWEVAKADKSINSFEHPLFGTSFGKKEYEEVFGAVLEELDGGDESCHVSFFFKRSALDPTHLVFMDEDAKEDFLEWAQEKGCMPSTKAVQEGEDEDAKAARKEEEKAAEEDKRRKEEEARKSREVQAALRKKREEETAGWEKEVGKIMGYLKGVQAAEAKIAKAEAAGKDTAKLQGKKEKAIGMLTNAVKEFDDAFPEQKDQIKDEVRALCGAGGGETA